MATTALTKRFPGVTAVDAVEIVVRAGEVVALLGANGAGKSTLIQMLAGVYAHGSYEGSISMDGVPFEPSNVRDAEAAGIVLIPQEVNIVVDLTVADNMFLNAEPHRLGLIDRPLLNARARAILEDFGLATPPEARMSTLDLASQQLVVIARALSKKARVLILDEPTAALTENEAGRLFDHMRQLRARGVACIFVSHRLAEVFAISDRIVVMRDGKLRGDHPASGTTRAAVVAEMVGGTVPMPTAAGSQSRARAAALRVENLVVADPIEPNRRRVNDVSLDIHQSEIVGLFGLLGSGCSEVALAIFGAWSGPVSSRVFRDGRTIEIRRPSEAIRNGIGLMAPDRRDTLMLDHSIADNIALASLSRVSKRGFVDVAAKRLLARDYVRRLKIRAPSIDTPVGLLSGGNQQKVQVARWLAAGSRILLLVDPTRGVDVSTRAEINATWRELAAQEEAILLVSSDAEELAEVCDRILIMRHGCLVGELNGSAVTEEQILHAAAGF